MNPAVHVPMKQDPATRKVQRLAEGPLLTYDGLFTLIVYRVIDDVNEHLALIRGDIAGCPELLVRVNSACLTSESFGALECDCSDQLRRAMTMIATEGQGIIIYLRQEGRGNGLVNKINALRYMADGLDTVDAFQVLGLPDDARDIYLSL